MASAVKPSVGVITNIAMDHIGLVNSIDEVFDEINQVPNAIGDGVTVLNYDDDLVMKLTPKHPFLCSMNKMDSKNPNVYYDNGIFYFPSLYSKYFISSCSMHIFKYGYKRYC